MLSVITRAYYNQGTLDCSRTMRLTFTKVIYNGSGSDNSIIMKKHENISGLRNYFTCICKIDLEELQGPAPSLLLIVVEH